MVLLEQIRTLDKRRLREHMGRVDETMMKQVDTAIAVSFGLHPRHDGIKSAPVPELWGGAEHEAFPMARPRPGCGGAKRST